MKTQNTIMLGAVLVFLVVGIVLWPKKMLAPVPVPVPSASKPPLPRVVEQLAPKDLLAMMAQPKPMLPQSTGEQRPFVKMGVLEADAILDEIKTRPLPAILQAMLNAGRVEHDSTKQSAIAGTLAGVLRERTPTPEFLAYMRSFIEDQSNSMHERGLLIGELGIAATRQTLDLLIQVATTSSDKGMSQTAAGSISQVGTGRGGTNQEELSPTLDRVWHEARDQHLLNSVASAMAQVGASSSMELLLSSALAKDGTDDLRKQAALLALERCTILNDHTVPPLAARLANQPPTSASSKLAGTTLARISRPAAALALLAWLQNANASAVPLVYEYLFRPPTQHAEIWEAALDPSVPFRSEANREAIRAALAQLKAGRTFGP